MQKIFFTALFLGCSLAVLPGAIITDQGKSSYAIVFADKTPHPHLSYYNAVAAEQLQKLLKDATGARLGVWPESAFDGSKKAIFIGNTLAAQKKGLLPKQYKVWEHHIRVIDGNIYLYGDDSRGKIRPKDRYRTNFRLGSYKAMLTLLEECAGAVFFGSPKASESIPKCRKFEVPDNYKFDQIPTIIYNVEGRRSLEYDVANNGLFAPWYGSYGGHNHPVAVKTEKYFKTHPEYFRLVRGKRDPGSQNQLCLSNPEVQKLIYQEVLDHLDQGYDMVQLAQSDGYGPCHCEACQKMFGFLPKVSPKDGAYNSDPCWGQKLWKLHLDFAERLKKDRPGKKVCIIAYGPTRRPPQFTKTLPENVMVELAPYNDEVVECWKEYKVPAGFVVYLYNWGFYKPEGLMPKMTWAKAKEQVKGFYKDHIKGIYRCGFGELFGLEGATYYVWCKLLADPDADIDALVKKYCKVAFPGAANEMEKFYRYLDERLQIEYLKKEIDWNDSDLLNGKKALAGRPNLETIVRRYPEEVLVKLDNLLKDAEEKLPPANSWQMRLARLELDYLLVTARAVNAMDAFKKNLTAENWKKAEKYLLAREKFCASIPRNKDGHAYWNQLPLFGYSSAKQLKDGGRLSAPLYAPFQWNLAWYAEHNVQPAGRVMKVNDPQPHYLVPGQHWVDTPDEKYTKKPIKVFCKADDKNLYVYFIRENSTYDEVKQHEIQFCIGPKHEPGQMIWFPGRFRNGNTNTYPLTETNAQRKGQGDKYTGLGKPGARITVPAPGITLKPGEVGGMLTLPFSKLPRPPKAGEKWYFNATYNVQNVFYMIWEHNFEQDTWRNTRDHNGTLIF